MGNLQTSPVNICLGGSDHDSLLQKVTGDTWLSIPSHELASKLYVVKQRSIDDRETFETRVERYINDLTIPEAHLKKMTDSFVHELEVGLKCHKSHPTQWIPLECSLKMLDSCIEKLPNGNEKGVFYALDFGGTSFRVVRVELLSNGKLKVSQKLKLVASGLADTCLLDGASTASQLFDFFAQTVKEFIIEQGDKTRQDLTCGFTFSFPCSQRKIGSAVLMIWTKGFETGRRTDDPVEGLDVAELMNVAFQRNNVPVVCNSVLNDTVGTLLSCAYEMDRKAHPPCMVGLILGTGMNACYYDAAAPKFGYVGKIINLESGNFNRDLPRTIVDSGLDFEAVDNRGFQQTEKMCSGAYLGEICRRTFTKVFQHRAPTLAFQARSLSTEEVSKIMNDRSKELIVTQDVVMDAWGDELERDDLRVLHRIATAVMDRSAALAAVIIAGCSQKTGRLQAAFGGLSVAIDGSLYKKNPWYQRRIRDHLDSILGKSRSSLIHLLLADDGSGKGASILASTLA